MDGAATAPARARRFFPSAVAWEALAWIVMAAALYALSRANYLAFHVVVELASIGVAVALFLLAWPAQRYRVESYVLFLACGYLAAAAIDLVHTMAYRGMGVFPGYDSNLATQLWLAARAVQAVALLLCPFLIGRRLRGGAILLGFGLAVAGLLGTIFAGVFPAAWVEGQGLTPFKIVGEYFIVALLTVAMLLLYRRRSRLEPAMANLLIASLFFAVIAELLFTHYTSVYGLLNMLGHLFKVASFYLIYRAVVLTGLERPYDVLFRTLRDSQDALAGERDNLVSILDAIGDSIYIVDREHHILYTNPAMRAEFGPPEGKTCHEYVHGAEEACANCLFDAVADGATVRWQWTSPAGLTHDVLDTPVRYPGKHMAKLKIMRDITAIQETADHLKEANDTLERRVRERTSQLAAANSALRESDARFRLALRGGHIVVAHADRDLRYTWIYNPDPDFAAEEVIGQRDDALLAPQEAGPFMAFKEEIMRRASGGRTELVTRRGGRERIYDVTAEPLLDANGQVVGVTTAAVDISEQRQAQRALAQAEKLTLAGKLATSFAHEIKNPLQSVIGCLGLARETVASGEDATRYFDVASEELRRANRLITQMRDMHMPIREEARVLSNANELIRKVLTVTEPEARSRHVAVQTRLAPSLPRLMMVPGQLEQVVLNLVLNALDAMPSGGTLEVSSWPADAGGLAFQVKDNGTGMPPEVAERIFEDSFSTKPRGLGLGLFLTRSIVERHGGRIDVKTEPGAGTAFTIWLPVSENYASVRAADAPATAGPRFEA